MARQHTKFLLTEGKRDQYAIASLMSHYVRWGDSRDEWPVLIEPAGSADELLSQSYLSASFKRSGLEATGILIDANDSFAARWESLRATCGKFFANLPQQFPEHGLLAASGTGSRLGIWIMPDNRNRGMLETFLAYLLPDGDGRLWTHAKESAARARDLDAPWLPAHQDKAQIHTWLAWQNPPGQALGEALLKKRCFEPYSPWARRFAEWFLTLYQLERLPG